MKNNETLTYLKSIDESDFRVISIQTYLNKNWIKRWVYFIVSYIHKIFFIRWALTFICFFSTARISYISSAKDCLIAYPKYSNEMKSLHESVLKHSLLKDKIKLIASTFHYKSLLALADLYRFAKPFNSTHLFVNIRQIQYLAYYYIYNRLLHQNICGAIITSTTNPHGLALYQWAKELGLKTIGIAHGYPPKIDTPLEFDQMIYSNRLHLDEMGGTGLVIKYQTAPQKFPEIINTIGIFLNKCPNLKKIDDIIANSTFDHIIIRAHPSSLITINPKYPISNQSLEDDIDQCDVIFAGNSSVHLDVIRRGKLSFYDPELDSYPHDLYGFVKKGIVEQVGVNNFDEFRQRRSLIIEKYKESYRMLTSGKFVDIDELGQHILDIIS